MGGCRLSEKHLLEGEQGENQIFSRVFHGFSMVSHRLSLFFFYGFPMVLPIWFLVPLLASFKLMLEIGGWVSSQIGDSCPCFRFGDDFRDAFVGFTVLYSQNSLWIFECIRPLFHTIFGVFIDLSEHFR